ncbi:MAG TPA: AsmA family protein [Burkholderiales bacterium]|jgi:AsmA protein|nr:AsmA family protein [Burkholderiales bacterium]
MRTALKWIAGVLATLVVALALFVAFGLDSLRGPITRAVTNATGRELVIDGRIRAVWSWLHPRFRVERVRFANADWAREDWLFSADAVEAEVRVLPLFAGLVVLPQVRLEGAEVNLERDEDGRQNWILDTKTEKDEQKKNSRVRIELLTLDQGHLSYTDEALDIDLQTDLSTDATGVLFAVTGTYQGLPLSGSGHSGPVLSLRDESTPFPLKAEARVGDTRVAVDGSITGLVELKKIETRVRLSGNSLAELYDIINIALPQTPAYVTEGRLVREGTLVRYEKFTGKMGTSDISGTVQIDTGGKRPFMQGDLQSKVIDLADLGVVVGTDQPKEGGVLPDAPFDPSRWDSVDADVRVKAGTIRRPAQLPLQDLSTRIQMKDRVLTLNPLEFGIAGGKFAGPVTLDGTRDIIGANLQMRVQKLQLAQLFPTIQSNKASVGDIGGLVELKGTGNSVAQMLGTANGKIGFFMDGGQISEFMMQLVALDLWGVAKAELTGDKPVEVRCAVADFDVKNGVMNTNAFVFDTSVVKVEGGGTINLKTEGMDLKLNPRPKDSSVASLNSPLYVRGTFSHPKPSPDVGRLAAKGVGAIVMGIINPLLAVLPLVKEGKGEDSACNQLVAEATKLKQQAAKVPKKAPPTASSSDQSAASGATAPRPPSK